MPAEALIGALQQRGTDAANATFRPLVADTLRQFARTGTAAGPVLAQLGRSEAQNLRDSLVDAQIKGMSGVDQMNQGRRSALESSAASTAGLANPSLQFSGVMPNTGSKDMATALASRANTGAYAPAQGMGAVNEAQKTLGAAYGAARSSVPDPNFALNQKIAGLTDIGTALGSGGAADTIGKAVKSWFGSGGASGDDPINS
jgi:hypothetical protein